MEYNVFKKMTALFTSSMFPYMSQTGASGHDGGLVDRHCIFGVVSYDGVA